MADDATSVEASPSSDAGLAARRALSVPPDDQRKIDAFVSFAAALGLGDCIYVSVPITGGPRLYEATTTLRCTADELRAQPDLYENLVLQPNRVAAADAVVKVRRRYPNEVVVNPALFEYPDGTQHFYHALWVRLICRHARVIVVTEGWPYSTGARTEVFVALEHGIKVEHVDGTPLGSSDYERLLDDARRHLALLGFDPSAIDSLTAVVVPEGDGSVDGQ